MRCLALLFASLALASCATDPTGRTGAAAAPGAPAVASSPECLAANLKPSEPLPVSAIPEAVLKKAQNGFVAIRYDVVAGRAQNVAVASSNPPGLYDSYALQHASRYRDPGGKTVAGCVMTFDIKF